MIRVATLADVPQLIELGQLMHAESPRYSRLPFSAEKVADLLTVLINSADGLVLVYARGSKILGVAVAAVDSPWFSEGKLADEIVVYVVKEKRGSAIAPSLITGLDAWAEAKGVPWLQAGTTTGVDPERTGKLYEHMGFKAVGVGLFERVYH